MLNQKQMLEEVMEKVVSQVVEGMKESITQTVERELSSGLSQALVESEFYRRISDEMRQGLQNIYKQIAQATKPAGGGDANLTEDAPVAADKLFSEASEQLDEILTTTEKATFEIMEVVEKHMELQNRSQELLASLRKTRKSNPAIQQLISINEDLGENLMRIMTSLSFQDLTGQRIKKIIQALKTIEGIVFELYMSTGLSIKAKETSADLDVDKIREESQKRVSKLKDKPVVDSELKGPQNNVSQDDIDDLLSQLSM